MAPKGTRIKTRAQIGMAPRYVQKCTRTSPTPSPIPSNPPSPPSPPPVSSWVTKRLEELAEGKLKIYHERGFLMDKPHATYRDLYVNDCVTPWGWEKFVEHPTVQVPVRLIHEFVANFPEEDNPSSVLVRGIPVDVSPAKINEIFGFTYGLEDYDYYTPNLNNSHLPLVHAKIGEVLCEDTSAQWDSGDIHTTKMTKKAQIWAKFMRSRLVPKQHGHKLSRPVALATYCILAGARFHPSKLMYKELCANSRRTHGPFYLPCLVKLLCDAAGVPETHDDIDLVPRPNSGFNEACLKRICESIGKKRQPPSTNQPSSTLGPSHHPPPQKGKVSELEEKLDKQGKLLTALISYVQQTRPCCLAAFRESFPENPFPELPSFLLEATAGPSNSKAPMHDDNEPLEISDSSST